MGLYDSIKNVTLTCPYCGRKTNSEIQFKLNQYNLSYPLLREYDFGDKIEDISFTGVIEGVAECDKCKKDYFDAVSQLKDEFILQGRLEYDHEGWIKKFDGDKKEPFKKLVTEGREILEEEGYIPNPIFDCYIHLERGVIKYIHILKEV